MSHKRAVLITGGTTGLGYYATLDIARKYPDYLVVISSRSDKEHAAESINKALGQTNTIFMPLDLSDTKNVRAFVKEWVSKGWPPIQILLLNAALQFPGPLSKTAEGVESTFAISHVGHSLLFHLLCPYLAPRARVVLTSSGTHDPLQKTGLPDAVYTSAEELAHPGPSTAGDPGRKRYTSTKLANVLWAYALQRRLRQRAPERGITVAAFDPGLMPGTGLAREAGPVMRFFWKSVLPHLLPLLRILVSPNIHRPSESGAALAWIATADDDDDASTKIAGRYFEGRKEIKSSKVSYDESKQDDIWQWTVHYLAEDEAEEAKFESLK